MCKMQRFGSLPEASLSGFPSLACAAARDMIPSPGLWEDAIVRGPGNDAPFTRKARKLPKERVLMSVLDIRRSTLSVKLNERHECAGACGDPPCALAMVDGMLVLAVDDSIVQLPNLPGFRERYFDVGGSPSALMSVLYDTMNGRILEADLSDARDERAAAMRLIEQAEDIVPRMPKVVLFDRGYASFELVKYLEDKGLKYCFRMRRGFRAIDSIGPGRIEDIAFGDVNARAMKLVLPSDEAAGHPDKARKEQSENKEDKQPPL